MYLRTVRGEIRIPSFSKSSLAIRSWPQVGFSEAMRRIKPRRSAGIIGRPGLDLSRQNSRQPARCQRITVLRAHDGQAGSPVAQPGPQAVTRWRDALLLKA